MIPTPSLHIPYHSFPREVYEPSEDTFLLIDALENENEFLRLQNISLVLEIGSGNGFPITFLSLLLEKNVCALATDINKFAARFTRNVSTYNCSTVDSIEGSLADMFRNEVFDLIISNPPYVPSSSEDNFIADELIDYAWRGGENGLDLFVVLVDSVHKKLKANGIFVCVLLNFTWEKFQLENSHYLSDRFREISKIAIRKSPLETLVVIRFIK
jgi:release factor glutamine methyltransferase